jgi:hypothetical protein
MVLQILQNFRSSVLLFIYLIISLGSYLLLEWQEGQATVAVVESGRNAAVAAIVA